MIHSSLTHVLALAGEQALLSELGAPVAVLASLMRKMMDAKFPSHMLGYALDEARSLLLVRLSGVQYLVASAAGSFLLRHRDANLLDLSEVVDVFFRDGRGHVLTPTGTLTGECLNFAKTPMQFGWSQSSTWVVRLPTEAGQPITNEQMPRRFDVPSSVAFGPSRVCSQLVLLGCDTPEIPMWAGRTLWWASDLECHEVKSCTSALMLTVPAQTCAGVCVNRVCWSPAAPDCVCVFGFDDMRGCAIMGVLRHSEGRWRAHCKNVPLMWQEPHFTVQHTAAHEIELRGLQSGRRARLSEVRCNF